LIGKFQIFLASLASGNLTNSGALNLDIIHNNGGSSLTVGGTLTNNTTLNLGPSDHSLAANTTVTAAAFDNNGTLNLFSGGASAQLVLGSGITSIASGSEIDLNGPRSFIALGVSPNSNSGLAGLTSNAGDLELHDAPAIVTNSGVNFANSGALNLDTNHNEGGSSMAIGGTLSNSTTINIGPGDHSLTANSTVSAAALGQVGTINLNGVIGGPRAALNIAGGPVTITSADDVELRDNASFSLASGNLTNSGALNLDIIHNNGGSSLTVGGTLTNNTTLNLGPSDSSLTANTMVTAGGLRNTGTANLFGNIGDPAIQATVTVNGQASNSGIVNLPTATSVTVTGAGNAYTQTAGSTNLSGGTLVAPNVNINGGKLQGLGTVTGALSIAGTGTIEAINLGNGMLPAAITNDGNYSQSGGTFDAPLHGTGVQIDKVDVTAGHTVTLTGGDLEPFGVTFALGQEFDDIMTFEPNELTGTFATILGGGNGTSVDLGNGLTLEAIYDNAGGDIALEVVKTVPVVPAPPIGRGVPVFLAVSGLLFGAKLLELSKKRRSLRAATPRAAT
jgi:fibronectin-binding autotransporter adhesin